MKNINEKYQRLFVAAKAMIDAQGGYVKLDESNLTDDDANELWNAVVNAVREIERATGR